MKKLFLISTLLLAVTASAWNTIQGKSNVTEDWVFWNTGSSAADSISTQIVFIGGNVYLDSSDTWIRIDDTADSCSKAVNLSDGAHAIHPYDLRLLIGSVRSPSDDSNSVDFNIETRTQIYYKDSYGKYHTRYTDWMFYEHPAILDSVQSTVAFPGSATGTTAKVWTKSRFNVTGDQMRLCPVTPADITADSVLIDSLYYRGR